MKPNKEEERVKFTEFARLVIDCMEAVDLEYLIGGAVAVWAWGEARTTRDLDLVLNLPGTRIVALSEELKKRDMLVPPEVIIDLLIQPEGDLPINAIHLGSGFKAEMFLLRDNDEYRRTSLARRRLVNLGEPIGEVFVHSPEDLILNKVHYYSLSRQTKHVRDIANIMFTVGDALDYEHILRWVSKLDLGATWEHVQNEAQKIIDAET